METPIWGIWWAWIVAGFGLAVLEVLVPGYIFVGFAIAAMITGLLIGIGLLAQSGLPLLLLIFAVLALISWLLVRRVMGRHNGQVKIWDRDINDNP